MGGAAFVQKQLLQILQQLQQMVKFFCCTFLNIVYTNSKKTIYCFL